MSPAAKTAMGVATSAAENLAVAGVSPYLVLPVLSAQGAAESMGQDVEKGTSAGQAVGVGLAKFGAGWAINSVGVANMARSMGVDYARDTVAGKLADLVRSSKLMNKLGSSRVAKNTISGGVDNAVQAFVETYADKIIDAALGGDQQAADELLQTDTFLQALQAGATGGASGALGGAVGTGLGAMSRTLDARAGTETAPCRRTPPGGCRRREPGRGPWSQEKLHGSRQTRPPPCSRRTMPTLRKQLPRRMRPRRCAARTRRCSSWRPPWRRTT